MVDEVRRKILTTGIAATAMAAAPAPVFAQAAPGGGQYKVYAKRAGEDPLCGSGLGLPLLLIAGGGLNSRMAGLPTSRSIPSMSSKGEYRCIFADLRNAIGGRSTGPLEVDRPWDSYTDDHLGLMDHLGIDKFMVLGFCIGGPFILESAEGGAQSRGRGRAGAARSAFRPEMPTLLYDGGMTGWGPDLIKKTPGLTMDTVQKFLTKMFRDKPDFVFTATRDFVKSCQTPVLIMPDDIPAHPYAVAMECAMLAPRAESQHVSVERAQGPHSAGGAPGALIP
jgi:pimeloyl-ACP methyl ester carboxylesterase